jgi:hypothetical protein
MDINSQRAKEIDSYLGSHPEAEIGKWPVEIGGGKKILQFYRFPITMLRYNVKNGRLAMEVKEWQENHKRELDSDDKDDLIIIRNMLLGLDKEKTKTLIDDLRSKGQMEPGAITQDGIVINGNRRMALLHKLHIEEPTGKWEMLEAIRLPDIGEKDLWKIEAGLQLSKDKVAEYHPVNELLKIDEGIQARLTPEEIAAAMYGRTTPEIEEAIERLKLINAFLEFSKMPGNYGFIKVHGLHEYFIDLQKSVIATAKKDGIKNREISKRLEYSFALIRAGVLEGKKEDSSHKRITHWDIRKLSKVYSDAHSKGAYLEHLASEKDISKVSPETIVEDFSNALFVLDMKEEKGKPLKLIQKAIDALSSIDRKSKHLYDDEVKDKMQKLCQYIQELSKIILKKH